MMVLAIILWVLAGLAGAALFLMLGVWLGLKLAFLILTGKWPH